ncbi:hypothetical protein [Campylobacter lanienae]|uniref:hypothetical protein n=1 Tax=Campylobacter lanienae TaxID=75658 RepID=UPI000BB4330F|nr:hypothetical protein [Campylobacter lanienae]
MIETYEMSIGLHLLFVKVLLGLLVLHLGLIFIGDTAKFSYIKRLMYFLPTYYIFMAFIFFTGMLNLAILHFSMSLSIWVMIVCWISLIPLGAIGFKRLKAVRINREFAKFKKFMLIKIICELAIVGLGTYIGIAL